MVRKKAKFVFRVTPENPKDKIHPDDISADDLAGLLIHLNSAMVSMINSQYGQDVGGVRISSITRGTITITGSGDQVYDKSFVAMSDSVNSKTVPKDARGFPNALKWIENFNLRYGTRLELRRDKKKDTAPSAIIGQAKPVPAIPDKTEVAGETEIYGRIAGISGIDPINVSLRLLTDESVRFEVSPGDAKKFGQRYYDIVGVRGTAVWNASEGKIISFTFTEMLPYEETPVIDAFAYLRENFHKTFDLIEDIDSFVRDQRGS